MGEIYVLIGMVLLITGFIKGPFELDILGAIFLVGGSIVRRMK